jgi:23S rRNA pseudouridine2457 synthase
MVVVFNKPYGVLTQFTDPSNRPTLANYISIPNIYAAGRLDADSEGLLVLTDETYLRNKITDPKYKLHKSYWVQVEGIPTEQAIAQLNEGVMLKDGLTRPAQVRIIEQPTLWDRDPPIRFRASIPTTWLEVKIREGRNRQIRRMTAAVGFPTLRVVRYAVGRWELQGLQPGEWRVDTTR